MKTCFGNNLKCKNCLWNPELWPQDTDDRGKVVLNVNLTKE